MGRYGLCKDRAERHKGAIEANPCRTVPGHNTKGLVGRVRGRGVGFDHGCISGNPHDEDELEEQFEIWPERRFPQDVIIKEQQQQTVQAGPFTASDPLLGPFIAQDPPPGPSSIQKTLARPSTLKRSPLK
ncbi:hypothetical protein NQ317_007220 [Molorchus minor]|uniref:Uncharacterized protein n=1 Tax=Molorchus minor TaxID=1323400 RepID=A0ABQ9IRX3_9CUCU|nr:hypothetical protein NQ317_007220 [Molorchus minor]